MTNLPASRRSFLKLALAASAMGAKPEPFGAAKLGANTAITGMGFFDAVSLLRQLGFPVIEIQAMGSLAATPGRFPGFEFDKLSAAEKMSIREALEGVRHVTTHLPYTGLHYFDVSEQNAASSLERLKVAMEGAAYFGSELAVIHTTKPVGLTIEQAWPKMIHRFRQWGDTAAKLKLKLAIETGTGGIESASDFVRFVKEIDHDWVGCTVDVGHQSNYTEFRHTVPAEKRATPAGTAAYNDLMHSIIEGLGPKIFHFHVHDINPETWREHVPVGTGIIDYPRLFAKLGTMDYKGLLVLEIAAPDMRASLADSKRRIEAFLSSR